MARKKLSNTKNQTPKIQNTTLQNKADREDKIINSMVNTSVILMSTMMGAFAQVMVTATGALASGMAEAMGGKEEGDKVNGEIKQKIPEVDQKMKAMISDIRKDIYSQIGQKRKELEPFLSDSVFDGGPKIIEKYDFSLPKLTQELDDNVLAQYSQLLVSGDIRFAKMFKGLAKWLNSLPQPPKSSQH
jgi:F0F1-type ATP synthase membrane subunit b/b'